ncbi:PLC-like phosphodiesterase [Radiomyces spectabilis]|uniref:PLC-like phosphodiesterase n=1 Tax=Radiomyces spectabilis TaxID=64574 RepID=UPI00221EDF0A|nr:PLC-like phosphodiesterase [Radiomyces spectabilis]KAI8377437.1 PLC-like phosphodiesterase [Radiomyces spectabilis]
MWVFLAIWFTVFAFAPSGYACNGHQSFCARPYSNITQLVTHDSYAVGQKVAATQNLPLIQQLNDGVRGIKLSAVPNHIDPSQMHVCHSMCMVLDAGPAVSVLDEIADWLKDNPNEVVTIMWNNLYDLHADQFEKVYNHSNIMPYIYTHNLSNPTSWPTLQEMIDSGKRVVNFVDSWADTKAVPWLMEHFLHIFETPYQTTNANDFRCVIDRPVGLQNGTGMMYLVNHFLYGVINIGEYRIDIPQRDIALQTNSQSLIDHTEQCIRTFGRPPNFIEVDFYDMGKAMEYLARLNGIPYIAPANVSAEAGPVHAQNLKWPTHMIIDNSSPTLSIPHTLFLSWFLLTSMLLVLF